MDSKSIAHTGDKHHLVKGYDIAPRAYSHAFFLSQTDVVARLLFHSCQNFFFTLFYINDNGTGRLDVMWTYPHPALPPKERGIVPKIRFEFEEDCAMLAANR